MNTGKAVAIIKELNSTSFTDEEKFEAIFTVADMETHNSITKDSLVNGIRWIKNLCEETEDDTACWEDCENGMVRCSNCKDAYVYKEWLKDIKWQFCPNCGKRLREVNNE